MSASRTCGALYRSSSPPSLTTHAWPTVSTDSTGFLRSPSPSANCPPVSSKLVQAPAAGSWRLSGAVRLDHLQLPCANVRPWTLLQSPAARGRRTFPSPPCCFRAVCDGLQLVNFLQDVPRDLALGRIYLPRDERERFGVTELDRPSAPLTELLRFEAERARALLSRGQVLQTRIGGRVGRAVGLFARGGLAALDALEAARWDIFTQRPRPSRARLALAAFAR